MRKLGGCKIKWAGLEGHLEAFVNIEKLLKEKKDGKKEKEDVKQLGEQHAVSVKNSSVKSATGESENKNTNTLFMRDI